jgi:hypothetical protein
MPLPLFPLDNAELYLRQFNSDRERHANRLRWLSHGGVTELVVTDVQEKAFDGLLVSEVVTLTHSSKAIAAVSQELAAHVNQWATMSAIVGTDDDGPTRLVAKVGIFSTDGEAAQRVYAPMLCMEAGFVGWHAAHRVGPAIRTLESLARRQSSESPATAKDKRSEP